MAPVGLAFSASQSPVHTPWVEMLLKHAQLAYFFAKTPVDLRDGYLRPSEGPGLGFDIDEDKVESETTVEFDV